MQDTTISRLVVVSEWNGKYVINEAYRPIAAALCKKFDELKHIPVPAILFVDNTEGSGKNRNKFKSAQVGKVPERWQDIIYQLTGRLFTYVMEFFKRNVEQMSREQIIALIYHELRHIGPDGEIVLHDIEDWANMVQALGPDWTAAHRAIPDLLADGVDWDSIRGPQLRLFEDERVLRAVK